MLEMPIEDRIRLLRSVSLFRELPADHLTEIAGLLNTVFIRPGEVLFDKGQPGDSLYFVGGGRIRLYDGERTFTHLNAGEVFGEIALLDEEPRSLSAAADEYTTLLRLDQAPFYDVLNRSGELVQGVIKALCTQLRTRMRELVEDFQYMQAMNRLTNAATALEAGIYDPRTLDEVIARDDAIGALARTFARMAGEIQARERRLQEQVLELSIQIDEAKRTKSVAEVTETQYFRTLQARVRDLRDSRKRPDGDKTETDPSGSMP